MATITVEDGTGKTDSTSYVSVADFESFVSERGFTLTEENGDSSQVLVRAMDYLESLPFKGTRISRDQALQWPRYDVYIDGESVLSDEIPDELVKAQNIIAYQIDQGNDPQKIIERATKREKVDVLEIEYQDNAAEHDIITPIVDAVAKLLRAGASPLNFRVGRG